MKKNHENIKWRKTEETLRNLWIFPRFCLNTQNPRRFPLFAVFVVTFYSTKSSTISMFFSERVSFQKKNQQPILGGHRFFGGKVTTFIGLETKNTFYKRSVPNCTCPWLQLRQRRAFWSCLSREGKRFSRFFFPSIGQPFFKSGVVSRFTFFEQYLECTATAMASAALTVDPHDKKNFSRIPSLGCFFIALMVSSHRVLNDCLLSFFHSTFLISWRSKTDSSGSLTLKYS